MPNLGSRRLPVCYDVPIICALRACAEQEVKIPSLTCMPLEKYDYSSYLYASGEGKYQVTKRGPALSNPMVTRVLQGDFGIVEDSFNDAEVVPLIIGRWRELKRRCEWVWAQEERADVVSRWNWLQAHVSDLEYRIRQHTDFYRQLRVGKGQVVLGDASPAESNAGDPLQALPTDTRTAASAPPSPDPEKADPGATEAKILQKPINGVVNMLPSRSSSEPEEQTPSKPAASIGDNSYVCARTRPVLHCKRRRVVRPDRLLPLHKKVQRSVPRPCEVSSSCVMCATYPGVSCQFPYSDPLSERLTLLDPAIHPVLSFPADVPVGLRLHSLLRSHNKMERLKSSKKLKQRPQNQVLTTPEGLRTDRTAGIFHAHRLTVHRPSSETLLKQHLEPLPRTLKCERMSSLKSERTLSLSISHNKKRHHSPLERDGRHEMESGRSSPASENLSGLYTPLARQQSTPPEGMTSASLSAAAAAAAALTWIKVDSTSVLCPCVYHIEHGEKKTKELSEDLRNLIVRKHEQSQGYKSISKDLNVSVSTVRSVIKKFKAHGTVANLPRCGRKRKIDKRFQRKIVRMLDKEPRLTSKQVQAALQSEGTTVSTRTIRRRLNEKGLYGRRPKKTSLLTPRHKPGWSLPKLA
ncbi:unnamed protein product [Ranitomeya imitator]|uniref:Transposase Tc1-like domain-containing protein n=1 Tax=Ranitomeya imitator TaxID=111125 RepID=A0ABN9KYT3_9NEOB|nr:unnamed protein product [Ranitomeya imitator]